MEQIALANSQLGEKTMKLGSHVCFPAWHLGCAKFDMLSLSRHPLNLPFPNTFRLVWDGITLRNGATVIPIFVVLTDHFGRIASELVDGPISQVSRGLEVVHWFMVIMRKCSVSARVVFRSVSGLRCTVLRAAVPRRRRRVLQASEWATAAICSSQY